MKMLENSSFNTTKTSWRTQILSEDVKTAVNAEARRHLGRSTDYKVTKIAESSRILTVSRTSWRTQILSDEDVKTVQRYIRYLGGHRFKVTRCQKQRCNSGSEYLGGHTDSK
ncbi:hypothetical protein AVEN_164395-1 [Araneus ventricosus]|uniref:Uncharacterized protein n=1 Tax=Araneus ventricosus TaxID=182803 RepID=A0A4Y2VXI4_ARAVE|nr:hypothetical protein AVEN_164395-1 [Araneus ventricosus]